MRQISSTRSSCARISSSRLTVYDQTASKCRRCVLKGVIGLVPGTTLATSELLIAPEGVRVSSASSPKGMLHF